jgi:hypothetical protein
MGHQRLKDKTYINLSHIRSHAQTFSDAQRTISLYVLLFTYRAARRRIPSYSNANSTPLNTLSSYPAGSKPHGFPVIKRAYEPDLSEPLSPSEIIGLLTGPRAIGRWSFWNGQHRADAVA